MIFIVLNRGVPGSLQSMLMDVPAPSPLGRGYGGGVCLSPAHILQTFNQRNIPLRGSRDPPSYVIRILGVGHWGRRTMLIASQKIAEMQMRGKNG